MTNETTTTQGLDTVQDLDIAIHSRYPETSTEQATRIRDLMLKQIISELNEGGELAFLKREGSEATLTVFGLLKQEINKGEVH